MTNNGKNAIKKIAVLIAASAIAATNIAAQSMPGTRSKSDLQEQPPYIEKLQQVIKDPAGYAAMIASRWQAAARASGRWDDTYAEEIQGALMKLQPDNLLAAGEASSYEGMMRVLATGSATPRRAPGPNLELLPRALGDLADDMVYTPVTPCRIVDTRFAAAGPVIANTTRAFDMDGSSFASQGGNSGPCGIPFGVAQAVAMTVTVTQPVAVGFLTAWSVATSQPLSSVINYDPGQTIANTTIVPTD